MDGRSRERYLSLCKAHDSSLRRGRGKTVEAHPDGRGREKRRECLGRLAVNLCD